MRRLYIVVVVVTMISLVVNRSPHFWHFLLLRVCSPSPDPTSRTSTTLVWLPQMGQ
jgi:hypothetical protein